MEGDKEVDDSPTLQPYQAPEDTLKLGRSGTILRGPSGVSLGAASVAPGPAL